MYFLGLKHKNAILGWYIPPQLHTKPSLDIREGKYSGTKSSNRIKISRFVQVNYYIFTDFRPPLLGVDGVGGYGWGGCGCGCVWGVPCMNAHTHACIHIHMHAL